jgi:hypothetical protein
LIQDIESYAVHFGHQPQVGMGSLETGRGTIPIQRIYISRIPLECSLKLRKIKFFFLQVFSDLWNI